MKKGLVRGLGVAAVLGSPALALADGDVWSAATTAVTTASTNTTALLIVGIGIPVAMLGYKVVKRVINRV
ncbi:MAG: hypothetical protein ABSB94_01370 [Syntrophorhabdales bacterium]|jgi:hypothetical protein